MFFDNPAEDAYVIYVYIVPNISVSLPILTIIKCIPYILNIMFNFIPIKIYPPFA